jgi:hypothetical protein
MMRFCISLLVSTLILSSPTTYAESWYKIEVVVFANQNNSNLKDEFWPEVSEIPRPSNAIALKARNAEGNAYKKLTGDELSLHSEKKRLSNSGAYRVLFHEGWMQPVRHTQNPRPIRITGGNILDNGMYELDGHIAVGRGTYLHFRPNLFLSKQLTADQTAMLKQASSNPPINETEENSAASLLTMQASSDAESSLDQNILMDIPEILTVNQDQARRMKSKELHFIDHPLMGILVEIKPVD